MSRLIIDTIRYYSATARLSLSSLIVYIRIRSTEKSYMKLSHIYLKFGTTRFDKSQLIIELHFLK